MTSSSDANSGPAFPSPPLRSFGKNCSGRIAFSSSIPSSSQSTRLRDSPILRSSISTRNTFTSSSSPTLTRSSGFSIFSSASSLMWSNPSSPSSRLIKTPKFVILVTFPESFCPDLYRSGISVSHGSAANCFTPRAIRRLSISVDRTLHSISCPFSSTSFG